ncbi:MAG TPA: SIS domain-containing protein [Elusimicrobiales bacterium]|nr:SIS domain-containing protein [Elusimicrobiales bacterium]
MKIEETLTAKDIREIPALLEDFSRNAGSLKSAALRSKDNVVYLVGRGSSGNATLFAKYVWETCAGTITNFIHPHSVFEAVKPLNFKGQAVWAFSQSGKSPDIVACLEKLIGWGARGTAVTNEADLAQNPLARLAGRHILLSRSPELPVAATKSFILQLWAVLWTAQVWSGCFSEKDFSETVKLARRLVAAPVKPAGQDFFKKLKKAQMIGFVGRGPYNAVADDSALKFREMARAHALGYSAAEFLHGPVGAYTGRDFVFLLSPGAALPEDLLKVKKALDERGTPYRVVAQKRGKYPFNCLLTDIEMKLLALNLALARGLNPDNPKGLKKVTLTF